ncbi:hypothetical protein BD410DRAFT_767437 [Rickenella mellea]|uniref:Uncharacterized protein n=1 Tax=Rickenella mellea TaxID=50990 RepID=A0A4Y7QAZ2_9AGAM|nr:hypothetical protein BD410DRAFT_767437 [Rickenella mellea]
MRSILFTAAVLAGSTAVHAISAQCQNALLGVVGSPDAACLNIAGITSIITLSPNSSLVDPVTNWLSGLCSVAPCSNQTLQTIVTNITTGCPDDLSSLGLASTDSSSVAQTVETAYPILRNIGCLKDTTTNTLCVTSTLNAAQNASGTTLTLANVLTVLTQLVTGSSTFTKEVTCTNCIKAAYNILKQDDPALATATQVTAAFSTTCGASFLDGQTPSGIVQLSGASGSGTSNTKNGAVSLFSGPAWTGVVISALAAVSAGFMILA